MTAQKSIFIALDGSANGTVPKGARLALGGLIEHDGSADPLGVKLGVLEDTFTPVVAGTAGMSYDVRAAVFVTNPTGSAANGPTVGANDAVVNVATTAAPGSNARYDVIWVRQHVVAADGGADSDNILEFGVKQGTVSASPSVPTIPTGALALANVLVTAGTVATNTLTFTAVHSWVRARAGSGGALRDSVVFTSSSSFNKADYPWLRSVRVRVQGGGGGSGGAQVTLANQGSAGDGGGGGGFAEKVIPVGDLASTETVTVGGGGAAGGVAAAGGAGGTSSFGAHLSGAGGAGGGLGIAVNTVANINSGRGGAGGAGSGGDLNIGGQFGSSGESVWNSARARGGHGGSAHLGFGTVGNTTGSRVNGSAGQNYGGGASGGACTASQAAIGGGAGAPGVVILELFG